MPSWTIITVLRRWSKRHVTVTRDGMMFDYVAKEGKRRAITVTDEVVLPTVRALVHSGNGLDTLFSYQHDGTWRILHSHDVSNYIAARALGGDFTAKEFRTWNATVLMALALANAPPSRAARSRERVIAASIREVAGWLGDTPAVARKSYIDPRLINRYESAGELPATPRAGCTPGLYRSRDRCRCAPGGSASAASAETSRRGAAPAGGAIRTRPSCLRRAPSCRRRAPRPPAGSRLGRDGAAAAQQGCEGCHRRQRGGRHEHHD